MLIVLELPLKDIAAVGGVDFLDGQLLGVLNGLTVDGGAAGNRANAADLDGGAGVSSGALTGCLGSARASLVVSLGTATLILSSLAAVEAASEEDAVSVDAEEPQAARLRTMEAASTELTSFFIIGFPPKNKATAHNGFAQPRAASLTKL